MNYTKMAQATCIGVVFAFVFGLVFHNWQLGAVMGLCLAAALGLFNKDTNKPNE